VIPKHARTALFPTLCEVKGLSTPVREVNLLPTGFPVLPANWHHAGIRLSMVGPTAKDLHCFDSVAHEAVVVSVLVNVVAERIGVFVGPIDPDIPKGIARSALPLSEVGRGLGPDVFKVIDVAVAVSDDEVFVAVIVGICHGEQRNQRRFLECC
jgi:hypothetical protein